MRVLVTGPESSGTRLATRIIACDPTITALHRSMPHGGQDDRHWPHRRDYDCFGPHRMVVCVRDLAPMVASQCANHLRRESRPAPHAYVNARYAIEEAFAWANRRGLPRWLLDYEALMCDTDDTLDALWRWLGRPRPPLPEPLVDGDLRWLEPAPQVRWLGCG